MGKPLGASVPNKDNQLRKAWHEWHVIRCDEAVQSVRAPTSSSNTLVRGWIAAYPGSDFQWRLRGFNSVGEIYASTRFFTGGGSLVVSAADNFAVALTSNFVVGPNLATGSFSQEGVLMKSSTRGNFVNTTAYMGFRFDHDFDGVGGYKYGWAKVRAEKFGDDNEGVRLILSQWAYDDSGASIAVGDTGQSADMPLPATPLLTLLGLGAMGVSAYRRRREEGLKRLADERDEAGPELVLEPRRGRRRGAGVEGRRGGGV
jgi:hypothetical protein